MALRDTTFTYKQTRRRASTTTARAYTLNSRQMELDRKSAGDIKRMADAAEKRLKALDTIRKKGVLPFTRQEMELEYRRLDDQIWFLTNQAENLRNVGGQADQIIAIEKLISVLTEHQNDIREIVNANIPFQNNIIKDVIGHTGYFLRQRAIVDPYKRVVANVGGAVRANSLGGVVLRSIIGAGLNRNAPTGLLRMAAGLSSSASSANIKKLNERRANTASPLDLLNRATSRKYKDVDTATAYNLEKAKLGEAKKQHKENKDQTEEANKIGEEAVEELKKANKTAEKMVREFKSQDGGGGLLESVGGALATMFGVKTLMGGGSAAAMAGAATKGAGFLGRWGRRLGILGGVLSVGNLAFDKREDGSKRAFFGEQGEGFLDSRAGNYAGATLAGAAFGGPIGAGIGLAVAFIADNWRGMREFQKEQNEELLKTYGLLPETLTEALDNSELGKFMSNDAKLRMIEQFGSPVEKIIATAKRQANQIVEDLNQNRTKYPVGTTTYTDMNGNVKAVGPSGEDLGIFDHRRIDRDLTQEEAQANTTFTQRGPTIASVGSEGVRATLDMIAKGEGGSHADLGYGYDAVLGDTLSTGKKGSFRPEGDYKEISQMTFPELFDYQDKVRKNSGKWNSSAVGRYQYVKSTLYGGYKNGKWRDGLYLQYQNDPAKRALMQSYGINFDEGATFSPQNQDAIATYSMMEELGGKEYVAGNMSKKDFLNRLSGYWASVQNSAGGRTYAKQRADTNMSDVVESLRADPEISAAMDGMPAPTTSNSFTLGWDQFKSRDVKSDLDYFGDDRSLQFNPAPSREPYNIPTFESPGVTPKYEPGNSPVVVPVAANTATPSTKKDTAGSNFPVHKQTTYGMPILNDIPILDTEMGVLLMTKQAG